MAALFTLSRERCYWPPCSQPTVVMVGSTPLVNVFIAHIRAASPGGPRYDPRMSDDERRAFSNVILLCKVHHEYVDRTAPERFSVEILERWKALREGDTLEDLSGLRGVSEARLQSLIGTAVRQSHERVLAALEQFEQTNAEAAHLLRDMFRELDGLRQTQRLVVDPDTASLLLKAANMLKNSANPDVAKSLHDAARKLARLPETVEKLERAAGKWERM